MGISRNDSGNDVEYNNGSPDGGYLTKVVTRTRSHKRTGYEFARINFLVIQWNKNSNRGC